MGAGDEITPQDFAKAFQRLTEWAIGQQYQERSPFKARLTEHFGEDPATYPLTSEAIAVYDLPNLQLALEAYLEGDGRQHSLVGFGGPVGHMELSLAGLVHDFGFGLAEGPVRRTVVGLEQGRSITCVTTGLFLITDGEARLAALVVQGQHGFDEAGLRMEVISREQEAGERFVADIRALMHEHNVFRGKVLALKGGDEMMNRGMSVEFPAAEAVSRDQIVLPEGVLDVVDLHTVEFAEHVEKLQDAGRHLRRGLLLHGPPGTGKTLSTSYLISRLEGRTVVILTGAALGLVGDACAIARDLQPALAARPGRVDQAVEFPLPDAESRSRLLDLFGRGLDMALANRGAIVAKTEGVSPAFLRELVRKAALHAARAGSARVEDAHFREALDLLERGGSITRAMLGADGGAVESLDPEGDWDDDEDWEEE